MIAPTKQPNHASRNRVGRILSRCPSPLRSIGVRTYQISLASRDLSVEEHVRTAARTLADGIGFKGSEPFSLMASEATSGTVLLEVAFGGSRSPTASGPPPKTEQGTPADRSRPLRRRSKPVRVYAKRIVIVYVAFWALMQLVQASRAGC